MPRSPTPSTEDFADPAWREQTLPDDLAQALRALPTPPWERVLVLEFGVLDAAAHRHLPSLLHTPPVRTAPTSGSVSYALFRHDLGDLGALLGRKLDAQRSECAVTAPARPRPRELTVKEQRLLQSLADRSLRHETMLLLDEKRNAECDAHHRWRCALQAWVISTFLERLEQEQHWTTSSVREESRTSGRPRKASHQWAYEQVHFLNRQPREVFLEWIEMHENATLADPLDSFKKAIRPKKGK